MSKIEARLRALGLTLPPPTQPPPGVILPFRAVRIIGNRALISGHGPQNPDGSFAQPLGKLGRELSPVAGARSLAPLMKNTKTSRAAAGFALAFGLAGAGPASAKLKQLLAQAG